MTVTRCLETGVTPLSDDLLLIKKELLFEERNPRYGEDSAKGRSYLLYTRGIIPLKVSIRTSGGASISAYCKDDLIEDSSSSDELIIPPREEHYILRINEGPIDKGTFLYGIQESVRKKAFELTQECRTLDERMRNILSFCNTIPSEFDISSGHRMPKDPHDSIRENLVRNCVDRSELMAKLGLSLEIPTRTVTGIYEVEDLSQVREELLDELIEGKYIGHKWVIYHDGTLWKSEDPSLGNFESERSYRQVLGITAFEDDIFCEFQAIN